MSAPAVPIALVAVVVGTTMVVVGTTLAVLGATVVLMDWWKTAMIVEMLLSLTKVPAPTKMVMISKMIPLKRYLFEIFRFSFYGLFL